MLALAPMTNGQCTLASQAACGFGSTELADYCICARSRVDVRGSVWLALPTRADHCARRAYSLDPFATFAAASID